MLKENLTFNDLPEMVGKLCERIESLENALKDNLATGQRKPACPHDRGGSVQLSRNIQIILLLQSQARKHSHHQAGQASICLSGRTGQMAGDREERFGTSEH